MLEEVKFSRPEIQILIISEIYTYLGAIQVQGNPTFHNIIDGASPQIMLTCISTGGPATTVTWTRDSANVTEGTQTVLNDAVTAQYVHTLNMSTGGNYTRTLSNQTPSLVSASITVPGMLVHKRSSNSCPTLRIMGTLFTGCPFLYLQVEKSFL